MNEKQFIQAVWDVLMGNDQYITQEQFYERYGSLMLELDYDSKSIRIMDEHNEWRLMLQKTWCDSTQS